MRGSDIIICINGPSKELHTGTMTYRGDNTMTLSSPLAETVQSIRCIVHQEKAPVVTWKFDTQDVLECGYRYDE